MWKHPIGDRTLCGLRDYRVMWDALAWRQHFPGLIIALKPALARECAWRSPPAFAPIALSSCFPPLASHCIRRSPWHPALLLSSLAAAHPRSYGVPEPHTAVSHTAAPRRAAQLPRPPQGVDREGIPRAAARDSPGPGRDVTDVSEDRASAESVGISADLRRWLWDVCKMDGAREVTMLVVFYRPVCRGSPTLQLSAGMSGVGRGEVGWLGRFDCRCSAASWMTFVQVRCIEHLLTVIYVLAGLCLSLFFMIRNLITHHSWMYFCWVRACVKWRL